MPSKRKAKRKPSASTSRRKTSAGRSRMAAMKTKPMAIEAKIPARRKKDDGHEAAGMLFVGSILIFGILGLIVWNTGLGWVLGVGIGFILMGLARMLGKH